jgi:sugar phosphate isomerase/epimerase
MPFATRRAFLETLAATAAAGAVPRIGQAQPSPRRMTVDLVCGAIGVKATQQEAVDLAIRHGFESVGAHGAEIARLTEAELAGLLALMKEKKLRWGAANLPVDFRKDDEVFRTTSEGLADFARGLRRAGVTRVGTWLPPSSDTLTYRQYFAAISRRLRETAQVLEGEGGLRLGLEYVGPKTAWASRRYPFLHTLAETRDLIAEIGRGNVGVVLDSWHWFLAGDTVADIKSLRSEDVVAVDLNDAPAGLPKDQQVDNRRELPLATGVIPAADFLLALCDIGYDGPVRAEPFNQALNEKPREEAVTLTAAAMKRAMALVA